MTVALALVLLGALLIYGGVTGRDIKSLLLGDNSVPLTPPKSVDRGAGTVVTSTGGTVTGTAVGANTKYVGAIHELFYDPLNLAFDEGTWIPAIGNHSDHVHVSFGEPKSALEIIAKAQGLGLRFTENPYAGGVAKGVHADTSYHYRNFPGSYNGKALGMAGDFSGTPSAMARFAQWVKENYTQQIVTHR